MIAWFRKLLGIKSDREVLVETLREPSIKAARVQLKRADHILKELETIEGSRH